MDSLIVPFLDDGEPLDEALRQMETTRSRAILVEHFEEQPWGRSTEGYALYMNRAVVDAWQKHEPTCRSLRVFGGEPVSVLATLTAKDSANTIWQLIEHQLDQLGTRLGLPFLPRPEDQTAVVVTRHEDVRHEITSASDVCVCRGPARHPGNVPPAANGVPCDYCDNTYLCV
ncbi:MAG TPA: hypothetical protein VL330_26245 [Actinomycetes bacterium]|nr:hypothetical protein [Actinomycetes bacterium]